MTDVNLLGSDESKLFNELCLGEHARVDEWSGEMIIGRKKKLVRKIVYHSLWSWGFGDL